MSRTQRSLTVLVVEGEKLLRWAIAEMLRGSGHEVIEVATAETARVAVSRTPAPIDVVLLDYHVPDSTDLSLLDEIRRRLPQSAVVLMTAHITPQLAERALDRGAFRVVSKPFDMDDLEGLVADASRPRGAS